MENNFFAGISAAMNIYRKSTQTIDIFYLRKGTEF